MKSANPLPRRTLPGKHHPLTIAVHWGAMLCIVLAVVAILFREIIGDKFWRLWLLETHRQLGLVVMLCVAVRLFVRQRHGMADHLGGLPKLVRLAALSVHMGLYGLMIGLPLLGWATTNAHGKAVHFLGLMHLPALSGVDSELAEQLVDYHVLGSWMLFALVGLHTVAALCHHYIRRDKVLWAMLPSQPQATPTLPAPERDFIDQQIEF